MKYPHTPGSNQAITDGCKCPRLDNARGKGCGYLSAKGEPTFIVNLDCPLHNGAEISPEETGFQRDLSEPAYGAASRLKEKIA
jgi:hypothetical protein